MQSYEEILRKTINFTLMENVLFSNLLNKNNNSPGLAYHYLFINLNYYFNIK